MRNSRVMLSAAILACGGVLAAGLSGFASADAEAVNAADAVAAIQAVAPTSLSELAATGTSQHSAAEALLPEGSTISIPVDAADGISLGDEVRIGLPFAQRADDAAESPLTGVVAYDNNNGSTTVPLIQADGTLQITTVIENARAPKRYDYPIDVPDGASLVQTAQGTIAIVTADGSPLRVFGDAWAKDANGNPVPTHYEAHGTTLTQVIDFTEHTAFPVVADPSTGVYSYNCVNPNGSSYFMKPGENLVNCKGSYLQKYINGKMVKSVALQYNGGSTATVTGSGWCLVSLAGVATLAFFPPTATFAWVVSAASTLLGAYGSCKDI